MKRSSSVAPFLTLIVLAIPATASADPVISWIDPPEEIKIPAPKEGNRFLKVRVTNKEPESVFLAAADSSNGERKYLDQTGEEEYTLNLSDPSVVAFARNADLSKGLRAYAQFHNRKIISSAVIRVKLGELFKKINLKCDPIRIAQRDVINLRGSHGQLQFHIDDISNGMTVVSIVSEDGDSYLDGTLMRVGDSDTFEIRDGEEYTITCEAFHNSLMGTDYATFRICKTGDWKPIKSIASSASSKKAMHRSSPAKKKTGPEFAQVASSQNEGRQNR
ncbi:MAG: hypothetical protein IPK83_21645 [Planctomycetes bacterium]|nr:hypothetical protein [Planctomycetota bacterium]